MTTHTVEKVEGQWDLSDLFRSPDDARLNDQMHHVMALAESFEKSFRGTIAIPAGPRPEHLRSGLETIEEIDRQASRVSAYAHLLFAQDTQSEVTQELVNRVEKRFTEMANHLIFFDLEWLELEEDVVERLLQSPVLAPYRHYLAHQRAERPYRRSEAEEKVMMQLRRTGLGAWQKYFTEVDSSLRFPITVVENGKKTRKSVTKAEVLHRLQDGDRKVRREAFESLYAVLGEERVKHGTRFLYNNIIEDHLIRDEIRGYPSFMTARHISNETTDEMVEAMLRTVERHYPLAHRYFKLKGRMMGMRSLELYDQYAPLQGQTPHFEFARARGIVLDAYSAFDERFGSMVDEFFRKSWIDFYPRPGKRGGAFCSSPSPDLHPYVLTNFVGTARDVMTLAHELGHAIHGQLSRKQTALNYNPPLTTCETASVFGESLTFDHMLRDLDEEAELALVCNKIEDIFATVFRQTVLTRFEQAVYEKRKKGLLTQEELDSAWLDANRPYYGDAIHLTEGYRLGWSYIPHFIGSRFYCYSYVFGQLLTMALYRTYREEGRSFVGKYVDLLSAGSSRSPRELFAPFGVDLEDEAFWSRGFVEIEAMVERAEALYIALKNVRKGARKKG
jgi:oligoendopeptidase F